MVCLLKCGCVEHCGKYDKTHHTSLQRWRLIVSKAARLLDLRKPCMFRFFMSHPVFQSLVAALVLTKLDFGNAALAGIPSFQLDRLQAVVNATARLVFQSSRHDHITPLLHRLHWLRAPERIAYKLAVLVYQCVHGLAPAYLADALHPVAGLPGRQRLRSSSTSALAVPLTRTAFYDQRPSVPCRCGKNLEQSAVRSDVFTVSANIYD